MGHCTEYKTIGYRRPYGLTSNERGAFRPCPNKNELRDLLWLRDVYNDPERGRGVYDPRSGLIRMTGTSVLTAMRLCSSLYTPCGIVMLSAGQTNAKTNRHQNSLHPIRTAASVAQSGERVKGLVETARLLPHTSARIRHAPTREKNASVGKEGSVRLCRIGGE